MPVNPISLRLDQATLDGIKRITELTGHGRASVVKQAVRDLLDREEKKQTRIEAKKTGKTA